MLFFLFRNWILLVSLPVIAGIVAFGITLGAPRTFTASVRIPAPPAPIAAFDALWRDPQNPHQGTVAADGSVVVSRSASTEEEARQPVEGYRAAVRVVAAEAIAAAAERGTKLSDMEARLIDEEPPSSPDTLADQATALAVVIQAGEAATQRASSLSQWSQELDEQKVAVSSSNGSSRLVPCAAFWAFTLALAIAIARWLLSRSRNPTGQ